MTPPKDDLIGKRFGRLQAIKRTKVPKKRCSYWECLCDCGEAIKVSRQHLISGRTKSCGCLRRENSKKIHTTHGMRKSLIYGKWSSMKSRCKDKASHNKFCYFLRGIGYCNEWENFDNFYRDMGVSFKEHVKVHGEKNTTLERIDVNKGYDIENCKWATKEEQAENRQGNFWFICKNTKTGQKIISRNQKKVARIIGVGQGSISCALKVGNFLVTVGGEWIFDRFEKLQRRTNEHRGNKRKEV